MREGERIMEDEGLSSDWIGEERGAGGDREERPKAEAGGRVGDKRGGERVETGREGEKMGTGKEGRRERITGSVM